MGVIYRSRKPPFKTCLIQLFAESRIFTIKLFAESKIFGSVLLLINHAYAVAATYPPLKSIIRSKGYCSYTHDKNRVNVIHEGDDPNLDSLALGAGLI